MPVPLSTISVAFASFACLIQLGTNLHNDYADFVKGADTDKRVGQARATQRGWLTPRQTAGASTICLLAALLVGTWLSISAAPKGSSFDVLSMLVTLSSAFNAVAYTGGPYPLGYVGLGHISIGYSGLGEIFVFAYFGVVATAAVPYLALRMTGAPFPWSPVLPARAAVWASVPIGLLSTAIIVVNNLRDRHTDVIAHKRTTAVRFGSAFARAEYAVCVLGAYACLVPISIWYGSPFLLLPLLSVPLALPELRAVAGGGRDGGALNVHVGGAAKVQAVFCALMTLGVWLSDGGMR